MGRFLNVMNPSEQGGNAGVPTPKATGGTFLKAMEVGEAISQRNRSVYQAQQPQPQPQQPNIFQRFGTAVKNVFTQKPYEANINKMLNENQVKLDRELKLPPTEQNQKKISEWQKATNDLRQAQNSTNLLERYGVSAKYKLKSDVDAFVSGRVRDAKSIFDWLSSLEANKVDEQRRFIDKQEETIKRVMDEQNIPENERQALIEKFSPRYQKDVMTGKSYQDRVDENAKMYEGGRKPFEQVLDKYITDARKEDPTFLDQLTDGIGSMMGFMAVATLTGGGSVVAGLTEAAQEAGSVYDENRHNGKDVRTSFQNSQKDFIANLIWNSMLNKFSGIFEGKSPLQVDTIKKKLFAIINGMSWEGIQEAGQQVMSNITTEQKDIWQGAFMSGLIGSLIGGGATGFNISTAGSGENISTATTAEFTGTTEQGGNVEEGNANVEEKRKIDLEQKPANVQEASVTVNNDGTGTISVQVSEGTNTNAVNAKLISSLETLLQQNGVTQVTTSVSDNLLSNFQKAGYTAVASETTTPGVTEMTKVLKPKAVSIARTKEATPTKLTKEQQMKQNITQRVGERTVKFREPGATTTQDTVYITRLKSVPFAEKILTDRYSDILKIAGVAPNTKAEAHLINRLNSLIADVAKREGLNPSPTADIIRKADSIIAEYKGLEAKAVRTIAMDVTEQQIRDYMDGKSQKFREEADKTDQMILDKKSREVTTKFLEHPDIKGKEYLGKMYVQNLLKGASLKAYEKSVIDEVLNKDFAGMEKIKGEDFRKAVQARMMPLDIIESNSYATYGLDNIGVDDLSNDEYTGNNATTYILNSPFDHGKTGHFGEDFSNSMDQSDVEIKEIPAQQGNPTAKFAVVRTGVELTRDNIAENVLTVANSREEAQSWIDTHKKDYTTAGGVDVKGRVMPTKGLFGHFRAFDGKTIATVVEIQSDAFQHGVGTASEIAGVKKSLEETKKDLADEEKTLQVAKKDLEEIKKMVAEGKEPSDLLKEYEYPVKRSETRIDTMKMSIKAMEAELANKPELTKDEAVFQTYKNIWQERIVREAVNIKAKEGFKALRFPTPRTVAVVEGFSGGENGNTMPYEIVSGDEGGLVAGDVIAYGGEEMTVVSASNSEIIVAESGKVNSFSMDAYIEDELNARWDDLSYNLKSAQEDLGYEFNTKADVDLALEVDDIAQRYSKFLMKERDITRAKERFADNNDVAHLKLQKEKLDKHERFLKLIKSGVLEKEKINTNNIENRRSGFLDGQGRTEIIPGVLDSTNFYKPEGLNKYGFPESTWQDIAPIIKRYSLDGVAKENVEEYLNENITRAKEQVDAAQNRVDMVQKNHDTELQEIAAREAPSDKELSKLPREFKDRLEKSTYDMALLEYDVRDLLETISNDLNEDEDVVDMDTMEEKFKQRYADNLNVQDDLEGSYGNDNVFIDGDDIWVVTEGHPESFNQPDEYEKAATIEDFDINDFDNEQKTVLEFYEKQLIPYLKKFRSGNLELIEDDNGYQWWETKLTEEDKLPPTAYRVKEDLDSVGIKITDAQEKEIIKLNKKWFGDTSVKITEQILANNKALGSYSEAMIKILNGKGNYKDTYYHEAVHKYIDVFLSTKEQVELFNAGIKKYRTTDLSVVEERMAEDFIKYAKDRSSLRGKIRAIFDKIMLRIQQYNDNADSIEKLYNDIVTGEGAKKAATPTKAEAPVGKGEVRESALFKRTKEQLLMHNPQFYGYDEETGTYRALNLEDDAEKAVNFLEKNPKKAIAIGLGIEDAPNGQTMTGISLAAAIKARSEGNYGLYTDIMNSLSLRLTRMGQEIVSVRGSIADESPENYIRQAIDARMEKLGGRILSLANEGVKRTEAKKKAVEKIKKETGKLKEKLSNDQVKVRKAQDIIDALRC